MVENRGPRQGLAEVTIQAYARRHGVDVGETQRCCHLRKRVVVMMIVCATIGSLIAYWLINSILESHRQDPHQHLNDVKSSKGPSHLQRLPSHVLPIEYTLKIFPLLEEGNFTITGDVEIHFYCKRPVDHFRIHGSNFDIKSLTINDFNFPNMSKAVNKYILEKDNNFIHIFLLHVLVPGESYVLRIKYRAPLHNTVGIAKCKYIDEATNETRWIVTSNFSPDYARLAFPCFDEPWIKAPFRISIGRRKDMISHSNSMRKVVEKMQDMPGYEWDHYEKTLPMSTYVLAIMVTDFQGYSIDVPDRPYHRIYSRKEVSNSTRYVSSLMANVTRVIQNLTGFYYEPDHLDAIMLPSYAYMAMENWGLIAFQENCSMLKNESDITNHKKVISIIAAHEVAHQWFGNLVTPKWWSDVWLKEGFSSFFGMWALSKIEASWYLADILALEYQYMFVKEGGKNAHPLHIDLSTVSHLEAIFDDTPYTKGNCLVHMIYHTLGEDVFVSSVHRYIRTYYYRSANQDDLWNVFDEELRSNRQATNILPNNFTMGEIMTTWTDQPGYPVLLITANRKSGIISIKQERFYNHGLNSTSTELWHIPLTWTTDVARQFSNALPRAWMFEKRMEINETSLSEAIFNNRWFLFNINRTGLYRVNYDLENWALLAESFASFSNITKIQLLNDAFDINKAGLLDDVVVFNLLRELEKEGDELTWSTAMDIVQSLNYHLRNSNTFKYVVCRLIDNVYATEARTLPYIDPLLWTRFKVLVTTWACTVGHKTCLIVTRSFVLKMLRNETSNLIPQAHRNWAYCNFMKKASREQWLKLFNEFKDAEKSKKRALAYALACYPDRKLLERYVSSFTSNAIDETTQKYFTLALKSMINNPLGQDIVMDTLILYGENKTGHYYIHNISATLNTVLNECADYLDRQEDLKWLGRLKTLYTSHDQLIDNVIEKTQYNIEWNNTRKQKMIQVLISIATSLPETRECAWNKEDTIS